MMKSAIALSIILSFFNVMAYGSDDCGSSKKIIAVAALIVKRASYMKDVAATKYKMAKGSFVSLYDGDRELRVLKDASTKARGLNVSVSGLLCFVQLQMDLSKQIQAYWVQQWRAGSQARPLKVSTLASLRKKISEVDEQLYPSLMSALPALSRCSYKEVHAIVEEKFKSSSMFSDKYQSYFPDMLAFSLQAIPK